MPRAGLPRGPWISSDFTGCALRGGGPTSFGVLISPLRHPIFFLWKPLVTGVRNSKTPRADTCTLPCPHGCYFGPMSGRTSQGGRSNLSSSSRTGDGPAARSSTASSSSSSARRRSGGGAGGARSSTSGKAGRSLQEISIPEGMDEEVCN